MELHVLAVGRVRATPLRDACDDYLRRLRGRVRVSITEVREAGRRGGTPRDVMRLEAEALRRATPAGATRIALTRAGRELSSRGLAEALEEWRAAGRDVVFYVGGAEGLESALVQECDVTLRLSALTLPHELARLVWLEQLYRATTIVRGEPYHRGED